MTQAPGSSSPEDAREVSADPAVPGARAGSSDARSSPELNPAPPAAEPGDGAAAGAVFPRPGGLRWGLLLAGLAVAIGVLASLAVLLTLPPRDRALAHVPSGTLYLVEIRPDLPAGQRSALGGLLGRLPVGAEIAGASDPVDALLEHLVGKASGGSRSYADDVAAYLAGPAIVAAMAGQPPDDGTVPEGDLPEPDVLVILSTDGSVSCEDLHGSEPLSTEAHAGVDVRTFAADHGGEGPRTVACARNDRIIVAGTPTGVRSALDAAAGGSGISATPDFKEARARLDDQPAAWFFMDTAGAAAMASAAPWPSQLPDELQGLASAGQEVDWVAGQLRVQPDGLVMETVSPDPRASGAPGSSPATGEGPGTKLAGRLPSSTVLLMDLSSAGALGPAATPGAPSPPAPSGLIPGLPGSSDGDGLLPFLAGVGLGQSPGRAAIVATSAADRTGVAVVVELPSTSDGTSLSQFLALLALAGGTQELYQGTSIVSMPVSTLAKLADPSAPDAIAVPFDDERILAFAVHDDLLVAGLGSGVVKAIIDVPQGGTLAEQAQYRSAMDAAGPAGLPELYVNVPGLVPVLEALHEPEGDGEDHGALSSWLTAIDSVATRLTRVDGYLLSRTIITIP